MATGRKRVKSHALSKSSNYDKWLMGDTYQRKYFFSFDFTTKVSRLLNIFNLWYSGSSLYRQWAVFIQGCGDLNCK